MKFYIKNIFVLKSVLLGREMKKSTIFLGLGIAMGAALIPEALLAAGADAFGAQEMNQQANQIKGFLFGAPLKIAGILGGGYGLIQALLSSSPKPLIVYGGIGLACTLVPKFIDGVFSVQGMLLP